MNNESLAVKLLDGQKALDRMKREVEVVVSMMVGLAYQYHNPDILTLEIEKGDYRQEEGDSYTWEIRGCVGEVRNALHVKCSTQIMGISTLVYCHKSSHPFKAEHVLPVHNSLDSFIKGMHGLFPHIAQTREWKALIGAAKNELTITPKFLTRELAKEIVETVSAVIIKSSP